MVQTDHPALVAVGRRRDDPRFAIAAVFIVGSAVVMVLHAVAIIGRYTLRPDGALADVFAVLDAGQERSLAAWWTAALLVTAALGAGLVAVLAAAATRPRREVLAWTVLAVLFAALSLDEIASIHERGAEWTAAVLEATSPLVQLGWLIPASVVLLGAVVILVPVFRALQRRPRRVVLAGLTTAVGAAMGLEFINVWLRDAGVQLRWRHLVMAVEETVEMAGVLIVLAGVSMAVTVIRHDGRLTLGYRVD